MSEEAKVQFTGVEYDVNGIVLNHLNNKYAGDGKSTIYKVVEHAVTGKVLNKLLNKYAIKGNIKS